MVLWLKQHLFRLKLRQISTEVLSYFYCTHALRCYSWLIGLKLGGYMVHNELNLYTWIWLLSDITLFYYFTYIYISLTSVSLLVRQWIRIWDVVQCFGFVSHQVTRNDYSEFIALQYTIVCIHYQTYILNGRTVSQRTMTWKKHAGASK